MTHRPTALTVLTLMLVAANAVAQENADTLAKQLSNPVASLISVPFQYNVDFDIGSEQGDKHYLNLQPVIPLGLNESTNLITRVIMPVIYQDDVFGNSGSQFGLGDMTPSFFFSPKEPVHGWILAAGPVLLLPTATDELLGAEKWGAGPTALALQQTAEGWTYGALVNHIWSFAGDDDRADVNATFLQPFLTCTTPTQWTFALNIESTYDWEAEQWSVPVNVNASKLLRLGNQLVSLGGGLRYWVDSPDSGAEGLGFRMTVTLLYPR